MKKFKLTTDTKMWFGRKLFRIQALVDFKDVKKGDLGGYVEKENNLSQDGNAWVYGNARVCGDAWVYGNARVCGDAEVSGDARVCGDACVSGNDDYLCIKGLGSCYRNTTFYRTKDNGVSVVCGCFNGTLNEFVAKVEETHGNSKYAKEYLAAVKVVKIHFELEGK